MGWPPHERTGLTEGGDRGVDNPGIHGSHGVIVHAQALHHAGAEGLHDDVGGLRQLQKQGAPPGIFEIQREAFLSPVRVVEVDGAIPAALADVAVRLPLAEAFYLNHLGAVVREHDGRRRARKKERQIENPNAIKLHEKILRALRSGRAPLRGGPGCPPPAPRLGGPGRRRRPSWLPRPRPRE